jgi:hypothetical protein
MKRLRSILPLLVLAGALNAVENEPIVMDLRLGHPQEICVAGPAGEVRRNIRLLAVRHHHWPNRHLADAPNHQVYQSAEVEVEVDGTRATLWARPFEAPQRVNGLRLYVETTRDWACTPQLDPLPPVEGDVRLACVAEGMPWGPSALRFPLRQYRWQANTYRNTWRALVPYRQRSAPALGGVDSRPNAGVVPLPAGGLSSRLP